MASHQFTLVLSGISELTSELSNALYEATGGPIELEMREGIVFLVFDRSAPTLQKAITSAIREVEGTNLGVRVLRVESESANTISKINADLLKPTSSS